MEEERREMEAAPQGGEAGQNGTGQEERPEGEARESLRCRGDDGTEERTEDRAQKAEGSAAREAATAAEETEGPERQGDTLSDEERRRAAEAERRAAQAKQQLESLYRQAEMLKKTVPEFDLERELENPSFLRLTAPHTGLSLEQAYYALHHGEIERRLARESMLLAVRAVKAGSLRPSELQGGQGASTGCADPKTMSREQRQALRKRIYEASAQGKKLPYGS